ncbi:hypothetical protein ACIGXF_14095 [Streptomyces sp. NPDC053086]|uniref:hypothetical protein n=1 Tax=unclassified Streptomyces TaxID=2593676 RepID=UPI0037D0C8B4
MRTASTSARPGDGGQHAIATVAAAKISLKHGTTPRGVHENRPEELQETVAELGGSDGHIA